MTHPVNEYSGHHVMQLARDRGWKRVSDYERCRFGWEHPTHGFIRQTSAWGAESWMLTRTANGVNEVKTYARFVDAVLELGE